MGSVTSNLRVLRVHTSQSAILRQRWVHQVISHRRRSRDGMRGSMFHVELGKLESQSLCWTFRAAVDHQSGRSHPDEP